MKKQLTRREFLTLAGKGVGLVIISSGLAGCFSDSSDEKAMTPARFLHGIASGDPTQNAVILWTRATPLSSDDRKPVVVSWEVATDSSFNQIIRTGSTTTNVQSDYTVKVDVIDLDPDTLYYYRFLTKGDKSVTGRTKTLADKGFKTVNLAVMSCANYSAGYFNVYALAAKESKLDAVIHLGDYIYEYGANGYASEQAEALGRVVNPRHEILSLSDYRLRHQQVKTDEHLQTLHAQLPFITVWDDHEVTNDAYQSGAENHQSNEGEFSDRKVAALQAYFEWMPIRPVIEGNTELINRSFRFGDLVDLHMLDTRLVGRDKQLDYDDYLDQATASFDSERLEEDLLDPDRKLLGDEQFNWLSAQMHTATCQWQVLGQQVLMGKMLMPAAIATQQMSIGEYAELAGLAVLFQRVQASDPTLTAQEIAYLQANQAKLTPEVFTKLQLPSIPYNLDAWDGYAHEREKVFALAKQKGANLVVLAGDTHNAWANRLTDVNNHPVGYEFAASSVTSPGLATYLEIQPEDIAETEAGIVSLIDGLDYMNAADHGFLVVTFEEDKVSATWKFVSTVLDMDYTELVDRSKTIIVDREF